MTTSKTFAAFFVLFFAFISFTNAHMRLVEPPYRGSEFTKVDEPPCGGFNEVNTTAITKFPLKGGNS